MKFVWYELHFPGDLDADAVLRFARTLAVRARHGLLMQAQPVVCEVESVGGRITWRVGVTPGEHGQVVTGLRQALPDLRLEEIQLQTQCFDRVWELRLSSHRRSLTTKYPEQVASAVLSALLPVRSNERLLLHWLIGPWIVRRAVPPPQRRKPTDTSPLDVGQLILDSEETKALRDKLSEPLFGVVGRIAVTSPSASRHAVLRQAVMGALQLARAPGVGIERRLLPPPLTTRRMRRYQHPKIAWPLTLNAAELTAVLGWPIAGPVLPGVEFSGHRHLPPSKTQLVARATTNTRDRITGESTFPGLPGYLNLAADDGLRGLHIIGPTGTGKSNLLADLALQDIAGGRGVVVVDPKRDLVDSIADRIPKHRLDDVVLLDPTDSAPVGINVLNAGPDDFVADLLLHIMRELYAANWGQRTADVIHNSVLSLARHGAMTLCELVPLLTHKAFRQSVVCKLRSDVLGVAPFWHWFESLTEAERGVVISPTLNKWRAFTNRKAVRAVIGQAEGFDLSTVMTERKIVLINLATGDAGSETGQLLGSLVLGALWAKIQTRSHVAPERRHPVFVYIDEFADLLRLPQDLGDALAKARGLGVGLVLAHQHLGQLSPSVKAAVGANARSRIVFQCGYDDATALAKLLGSGVTTNDVQRLRKYETYQALCHSGRTLTPASAVTLSLGPSLGTIETVRRSSRERYGVERALTDQQLVARRQVEPPASEVGARRRRS